MLHINNVLSSSQTAALHLQAGPGSIFAALADGSTLAAKLHAARANAMRTLFVLGQLARHGEHVQAADFVTVQQPTHVMSALYKCISHL